MARPRRSARAAQGLPGRRRATGPPSSSRPTGSLRNATSLSEESTSRPRPASARANAPLPRKNSEPAAGPASQARGDGGEVRRGEARAADVVARASGPAVRRGPRPPPRPALSRRRAHRPRRSRAARDPCLARPGARWQPDPLRRIHEHPDLLDPGGGQRFQECGRLALVRLSLSTSPGRPLIRRTVVSGLIRPCAMAGPGPRPRTRTGPGARGTESSGRRRPGGTAGRLYRARFLLPSAAGHAQPPSHTYSLSLIGDHFPKRRPAWPRPTFIGVIPITGGAGGPPGGVGRRRGTMEQGDQAVQADRRYRGSPAFELFTGRPPEGERGRFPPPADGGSRAPGGGRPGRGPLSRCKGSRRSAGRGDPSIEVTADNFHLPCSIARPWSRSSRRRRRSTG